MLIGRFLCSDRSHFPTELEVPQETTERMTNQNGREASSTESSLDATQSLDSGEFQDRVAQNNSHVKQGHGAAALECHKAGRVFCHFYVYCI